VGDVFVDLFLSRLEQNVATDSIRNLGHISFRSHYQAIYSYWTTYRIGGFLKAICAI